MQKLWQKDMSQIPNQRHFQSTQRDCPDQLKPLDNSVDYELLDKRKRTARNIAAYVSMYKYRKPETTFSYPSVPNPVNILLALLVVGTFHCFPSHRTCKTPKSCTSFPFLSCTDYSSKESESSSASNAPESNLSSAEP